MEGELEFSELLMSKLCHDLAGPIGAINNGVELLKDEGQAFHEESMDLIEISSKDVVARLLYFRQAYGKIQNGISIETMKDIVSNFYINKNLTFIWPEMHGDTGAMQIIKPEIVKLILNSLLIVSGSLIHGGSISIKIKSNKNDIGVKIHGKGKSIKIHEYIVKALTNNMDETELCSRNVQAYMTYMLAKKAGSKIKIDSGDNYFEIVIS